MPFMALKGYFDICRTREHRPEPFHELTEEEALALSECVSRLEKGDVVRVTYYDTDAYVTREGAVSEVVPELGYIRIIRQAIEFEKILSVEPLSVPER